MTQLISPLRSTQKAFSEKLFLRGKSKCSYYFLLLALFSSFSLPTATRAQQPARNEPEQTGSVPVRRVNVVERTATAINY